jgi:phospholipid transport system substrate-binding protein
MSGGVDMKLIQAALAAAIVLFGFSSSSYAQATAPQQAATAQDFVRSCVDSSLSILNNASLTREQKDAQFRTFLLSITDLSGIADYTLGATKRTTSPEDLAAFESAFRDYAIAAYETQFDRFSGQTLKIVRAVPLAERITVVSTKLIQPNPRSNKQPLDVDFRIFGTAGNFLVGDVTVMNIDLAITVQDQFQNFLWQHKNDVKALTAEIVRRTQKMTADRAAGENESTP